MNYVHEFIENLDIKNEYIVAAISGGPDSMFLLDILIKLRDKMNYKIVCAHVHHNLRKESDLEAVKVEKFCKEKDIIFEFKKIEGYPNNKFNEDIARKIRYEFFDSVVSKYGANVLFTAHHGDDLVETVLMRLTRGSSLKGYAGISQISIDRGYKIARPLLYLTKKDIEENLENSDIDYSIDLSNTSDKYTRNRYRKYILPRLKEENENVHLKFLDYSEKLLMSNEYLTNQSLKYYSKVVEDNFINVIEFQKLEKIIQVYVLEHYLNNVYKENIGAITNTHKNIIMDALNNSKNISIDLPNSKTGIIEYNKFNLIDKKNNKEYDIEFTDKVKLYNEKEIITDNSTKLTTNFVIHLYSNDIKLPFHVRNWRIGDRMKVKNMSGSKKVSDILTNSKIPKDIRRLYPVVTDSTGEIIWIPGVKKSHLDRKKEGKYDIILKYN